MRLSKNEEEEFRLAFATACEAKLCDGCDRCALLVENSHFLLEEIDALREEKSGLYADLTGQEHLLGSKIEILESRVRKLTEQNSDLRKLQSDSLEKIGRVAMACDDMDSNIALRKVIKILYGIEDK